MSRVSLNVSGAYVYSSIGSAAGATLCEIIASDAHCAQTYKIQQVIDQVPTLAARCCESGYALAYSPEYPHSNDDDGDDGGHDNDSGVT